MKKSKKKLLSLIAAMGITGGLLASPLNQVTAKAEILKLDEGRQTPTIYANYSLGVRFKLRARANSLYKSWWQVNLSVIDGKLKMTGPTNMPSNLTFDDEFIIHVFDANTRYIKFIYRTDYKKDNASQMAELMNAFNRANVGYGDYVTIIGRGWDGTVRFDPRNNPIIQTTRNDYTQGYRSINKYNYAFRVQHNGLFEHPLYWSLMPFYFGY